MLIKYIAERVAIIDAALRSFIFKNNNTHSSLIFKAINYSLFAGGKRLRPILLMAAADVINNSGIKYIDVACAIEMIHTYSLIHDDLPSMDNDDLRRGKPTNHKVFGEGLAILAGDALLTGAFEILSDKKKEAKLCIILDVIHEIAVAAGVNGMIGGQAIDIALSGKVVDFVTLKNLHCAKTGALFKASLRSGGKLAGANDKQLDAFNEYAHNFGLAFQIIDDILDVTSSQDKIGKSIGSDIKNKKMTYASMYTIDEAKKYAKKTIDKAIKSLHIFGSEADILREIAKYLLQRNN